MAAPKRPSPPAWDPFGHDAAFWDDPFGFLRSFRERLDSEIKIEQFTEGDAVVIRAEMPGIDPEKDVEICVRDGLLHIRAERREEQRSQERSYVHSEITYGAFHRTVALPAGTDEADVTATYRDGVLEVRLPVGRPPDPGTRIPVTRP